MMSLLLKAQAVLVLLAVGVIAQAAKYQKSLYLNEDFDKSMQEIRILRPDLLDWYLL